MSGFLPSVVSTVAGSVNDTSVAAGTVLIDSTVAMATNIIFQPSVSASGQGIYKTWAEVMAVVAEVQYPLTIGVSFEGYGTTTIAIPAGSYDMKQATLVGVRYEGFINTMGLKLDPGAQLINLAEIRHIMIWTQETTAGFPSLEWTAPVAPASTIRYFRVTDSAMITNSGTQPVIIANSTHGRVNIVCDRAFLYSRYSSNTAKLIHCLSGASVGISFHATPSTMDNSVLVDSVDSTSTLFLSNDELSPTSVDAIVAAGFLGTISWSAYDGIYGTFAHMPDTKYIGGKVFNTSIGRSLTWNGTAWISEQPIISSSLSIYISNSTGNDGYTGLVGFPLKTFAEFVNRYGVFPTITNSAVLTITFLDATVAEDITFKPILQGGRVLMQGTLTQVGSGTFTSAPTLRNKATNTYLEITDAAQTWATFIGTALLRNTTHNGYAWAIKDTGSHKARLTTLMTSDVTNTFGSPTEVTTSAINDTYTLSSPTNFTGRVYVRVQGILDYASPALGNLSFQYAKFSNTTGSVNFTADGTYLNLHSCIFDTVAVLTSAVAHNCFTTANGSLTMTQLMITPSLWGGGSLADMVFSGQGTVQISLGVLNQGKRLFADGAPVWLTDYMAADWAAYAIMIHENGTLMANGGISGTSATAGTYVLHVKCGVVQNLSGTTWVLAIPATGADATVGAGFKMGNAAYTQGSPYSAGALLAETTYTFAHLDAAKGAGTGFGGGTSRLDCFAVMSM